MSFDDQFEELAALSYRTAFRIVGQRAVAEEIAQETLAKAHRRWRKIRDHARPWVCRVASNAAISVVRQRRRRAGKTAPIDSQVDDSTAASAVRLDLQQVLLVLPKRQREVVALRFVADLTEAEVATTLGISIGSVKTHARRGLDALRHALDTGEVDALAPIAANATRSPTNPEAKY